MSEKEYPMDEDYNEKSANLIRFVEKRDKVLAAVKHMTPEQRRAVQEPLKILNESIEALEEYLAEAYEEHQRELRAEKEKKEIFKRMRRKMHELYIVMKHQFPEKLEEFTKCLDPMSPEQREDFFDQVAILEATELDEILGEKNLNSNSVSE